MLYVAIGLRPEDHFHTVRLMDSRGGTPQTLVSLDKDALPCCWMPDGGFLGVVDSALTLFDSAGHMRRQIHEGHEPATSGDVTRMDGRPTSSSPGFGYLHQSGRAGRQLRRGAVPGWRPASP